MRALVLVALIATGAAANPLDIDPAVQRWFHAHQHPTEAERQRDFARCLTIEAGNPDAALDCAVQSQTFNAWGVPRK
jgi:hypothetical protein